MVRYTSMNARGVYVYLDKKYENKRNKDVKPSYKITLLIPQTANGAEEIDRINELWDLAINEGKNEFNNFNVSSTGPYYDGNSLDSNGNTRPDFMQDMWCISSKSEFPVQCCKVVNGEIVDADPSEAYNGMNCAASIIFKPYKRANQTGIGIYLDRVLILEGGEPITFGNTNEEIFGGNIDD